MISKRIFDIFFSFLGMLVLFPIFAVVFVVIALKMPDGPVLFRQRRVGRFGRLFTLVKFRTMYCAEAGTSTVSVAGESRITPLGAFLRRYKLDELPELWNVLIGDMSFVGPRPDVVGYADCLTGEEREILSLRPGITCPATLKYRHEEELLALQADPQSYNDEVIYPDKVRMNLEYVRTRTFWGDVRIIFETII